MPAKGQRKVAKRPKTVYNADWLKIMNMYLLSRRRNRDEKTHSINDFRRLWFE